MIYISISADSVEIIQTSKGFFDREEKITACSRKVAKAGDSLTVTITEALKTAYPAAISQAQARLVVPDKDIIINRFPVAFGNLTSQDIVAKAKKILPDDITHYENFYKEFSSENGKSVLFTALPLSVIKNYLQILSSQDLKLNFLSISAFSVYALLKPQINKSEIVLYVNNNLNDLNLVALDSEGPVEILEKKSTEKTLITDIKSVIKKIAEAKQLKVGKLFLAGEKSLEVVLDDFSKQLELPVLKMSSFLQELVIQQSLKIDTGGVPLVYFDKVIGLINLSKMTDVPNFAVDLKNVAKAVEFAKAKVHAKIEPEMNPPPDENQKVSPQVKMEVEEDKEVGEELPASQSVITDNVIEYRKSGWSFFAKNRIVLVGLFLSIALILFGGFIIIGQSQVNLPFMTSPSPTPTITPSPTVTPTPTIDPTLKRDNLKLKVLNGTDKTGFAKETSEKLKEKGYKSVDVGNADRDDYAGTVIRIKDDKKNYLTLLVTDLITDFDTSTVESLPSDSAHDVEIILGKK